MLGQLMPINEVKLSASELSKWSDWSDCSENCVRTRQRWNCDDLVQQSSIGGQEKQEPELLEKQQHKVNGSNQNSSIRDNKQGLLDIGELSRLASKVKREIEEELKKETNDDDDDEDGLEPIGSVALTTEQPDIEDERDNCAGIDSRKIYQEIPCIGGRCLRTELAAAGSFKMNQGNYRTIQSRTKITGKQHEDLNSRTRLELSGQTEQALYPLDGANKPQHGLSSANPSSQHRRTQTAILSADTTKAILEPASPVGKHYSNGLHKLNAAAANFMDESRTTRDQPQLDGRATMASIVNGSTVSTIWSTRNMWPGQLLSGSDPAANLIQWTILISFLLAIILLIMLIVRKLFVSMFPSYHWLLAKQAIKTTCNSSQLSSTLSGNCSCHGQHKENARHLGPAHLATYQLSSSNILGVAGPTKTETISGPNVTNNLQPPHHMCYAWRQQHHDIQACDVKRLQSLGARSVSESNSSPFHQCLIDTNGIAHLLSPTSTNQFNTDHIVKASQTSPDGAHIMSGSSVNMNGNVGCFRPTASIKGITLTADNEHDDGGSIVSVGYNFDYNSLTGAAYDIPNVTNATTTLDSRQAQVVSPCNKSELILEQRRHSIENDSREHFRWIANLAVEQDQNEASSSQNKTTNKQLKHNSPNVPSTSNSKALDKRNSQSQQQKLLDSQYEENRSAGSRASSISDSPDNNSTSRSSSMQSTTAQILSNEGSSLSFEHSDHLTENSTAPTTPNLVPQSNSLIGVSPISNPSKVQLQHRRQASISHHPAHSKQASPLAKVVLVQSQPNSPMFANRIGQANPNSRHTHRLAMDTKSQSTDFGLQDQTSSHNNINETDEAAERHYYEEIHQGHDVKR